jgi:1-acyl-sn-glycerol-3-phosphate acyltransferase
MGFLYRFYRNVLGFWPLAVIPTVGLVLSAVAVLLSARLGVRVMARTVQTWGKWALRGFMVRVHVRGLEHVKPDGQYVVCSNHRSHMDVPIVLGVIKLPLVAVYKRSLRWVPVIGQALALSGSVGLDRRDAVDARRRMERFAQCIGSGRSVMIFPEGKRSRGAGLEPFKKGAVDLAIDQQGEILPVTIVGTDQVYPPGRFLMTPGTVLVVIHPPLSAKGAAREDRERLNRQLQEIVASAFVPGAPSAEMMAGAVRVF